jgi:hypothetical protein
MDVILLSTAYLGPIQYYREIASSGSIIIEQFDSYDKQTYRNRCRILAANGPLDLSIPVVKKSGLKMKVKEVEIDYVSRWQAMHWRSILSAYNSSPFFEFYIDSFEPFFIKKWKFLIDFNLELQKMVFEHLDWKKEVGLTSCYQRDTILVQDLREAFSPKAAQAILNTHKELRYTQTFHDKFDFIPNLSIIDLLFNTGPGAASLLV